MGERDRLRRHQRARAGAARAARRRADLLDARLLEVERANLALYGYGAKAFTLSLIETAIDLAGDQLAIADVQVLLDAGKELLAHPVELLPGAREAVRDAGERGLRVLVITKGDLFHQESKVARSGFGDLVSGVEVVAEKDVATYGRVLAPPRAGPGALPHGRQRAALRHRPGAGARRLGRLRPAPADLGPRARDRRASTSAPTRASASSSRSSTCRGSSAEEVS